MGVYCPVVMLTILRRQILQCTFPFQCRFNFYHQNIRSPCPEELTMKIQRGASTGDGRKMGVRIKGRNVGGIPLCSLRLCSCNSMQAYLGSSSTVQKTWQHLEGESDWASAFLRRGELKG